MIFKQSLAAAAVLAIFAITATGCGADTGSSTTAASETSSAAAPAAMTAAATSATPAECSTYLSALQTCVEHVSAPDAASQVRETLDVAQASVARWNGQPDAQREYCISSASAWASRRANFGC